LAFPLVVGPSSRENRGRRPFVEQLAHAVTISPARQRNFINPDVFNRHRSGTNGVGRVFAEYPENCDERAMRTTDPSELPLGQMGLFLDVDGTLLDIAPRPEAVVVAPGLVDDLAACQRALGGALALVSGRPIADLDQLFAPLRLCVAGVHGAEFRCPANGSVRLLAEGRFSESFPSELELLAGEFPDSYVEDKGVSFALHYPVPGTDIGGLKRALTRLMRVMDPSGEALRLAAGHAVFEIQLNGFDKGRAMERFMEQAPFCGRIPVFLGDDEIDRPAFDAALALGGFAFSVGAELPRVSGSFSGPDAVRAWLHGFAQ
jgi:trehalose 6-phosphate phosphatase